MNNCNGEIAKALRRIEAIFQSVHLSDRTQEHVTFGFCPPLAKTEGNSQSPWFPAVLCFSQLFFKSPFASPALKTTHRQNVDRAWDRTLATQGDTYLRGIHQHASERSKVLRTAMPESRAHWKEAEISVHRAPVGSRNDPHCEESNSASNHMNLKRRLGLKWDPSNLWHLSNSLWRPWC